MTPADIEAIDSALRRGGLTLLREHEPIPLKDGRFRVRCAGRMSLHDAGTRVVRKIAGGKGRWELDGGGEGEAAIGCLMGGRK